LFWWLCFLVFFGFLVVWVVFGWFGFSVVLLGLGGSRCLGGFVCVGGLGGFWWFR
jgi:hypothetical protein